jgi:PAS domain S-box-containing protein
MASRRNSALDKILGRLDDLDSVNLTNLVQRLARERRLLETVINTMQDGILVIDDNGIIQYANGVALNLIGLKEKEVGSAILWKVVPDLARTVDFHYSGDVLDTPDRVVSQEVELTYPDRRFVRLYMVPLNERVSSAQDRGFAVVLSDITEDKTSTQELIESEKINSIMNLAAGVAHELGNPLNSLTIHLQLMERQLGKMEPGPETEKLTAQLDICKSEVSRLDGIIENFLEAVRPQTPDLDADFDLQTSLAEVLKVQGNELEDKGIEVDVEVTPDLPHVMADRNQIQQVLFNLLKNAMEVLPPGGQIEIRTHSNADTVSVQISDNGPGIPAAVLPKVFQPYFTTKKEGHGLGMMIVQRIMRDHGGDIGIESRPGVGTRITLRFPRRDRRARMIEAND